MGGRYYTTGQKYSQGSGLFVTFTIVEVFILLVYNVYIDKSEYSSSRIIHGELTQNVSSKENIRQAVQLTLTFSVL